MSETTKQFKKQLPRNAIMSGLSFVTYSLSAIWLTPYLVRHLGAAAYGLIPLAGLLTQYAAIITKQISGAVNRFLIVELNSPDGEPNCIFNSALLLYLLLILLQLPLYGVSLYYADQIFSIPPELKNDALILIGCSALSFLVSLVMGVFGVSLYSANRIDIASTLGLARLLERLLLIIVCFSIFGAKLRYIGYIDLLITVVHLPVSIYFWRRFTPELSISFRFIRWSVLAPIFQMSFWSLINQLGGVLLLRMDIWIINRFISPSMAGIYAAIIVVANSIRQLGMFMNNQLGPIIMRYWAKDELQELQRLVLFAVKILSITLVIPSALICFNAENILGLWLDLPGAEYSLLLIVLCMHLPFTVSFFPLYTVQTATNSLKIPSLVTVVVGGLNLFLSYYLGVSLEFGALGVAIATAVVLLLRNTFFTAVYGAHLLKLPIYAYFKPLFSGITLYLFIGVFSFIPFAKIVGLNPDGLNGLLFNCSITAGLAAPVAWWLCFSTKDRNMLISFLPGRAKCWAIKINGLLDRPRRINE